MAVEYRQGAELPDISVTWNDEETGLLDFSTGWSFSALIGQEGQVAELTKVTGFTGSATAPNLKIAWTPGELDVLGPGSYVVDVQAHHTASNKDRKRAFPMTILAAVQP
jgi:hypothetical protein